MAVEQEPLLTVLVKLFQINAFSRSRRRTACHFAYISIRNGVWNELQQVLYA